MALCIHAAWPAARGFQVQADADGVVRVWRGVVEDCAAAHAGEWPLSLESSDRSAAHGM